MTGVKRSGVQTSPARLGLRPSMHARADYPPPVDTEPPGKRLTRPIVRLWARFTRGWLWPAFIAAMGVLAIAVPIAFDEDPATDRVEFHDLLGHPQRSPQTDQLRDPIQKEFPTSVRKIDAAVAAAMAWDVRLRALALTDLTRSRLSQMRLERSSLPRRLAPALLPLAARDMRALASNPTAESGTGLCPWWLLSRLSSQ